MSTAEVIAQKIFKAYGDNAYHIPRELHDRIDHIAKKYPPINNINDHI